MCTNIKIKYDGAYPCLCMGKLIVTIGEKKYIFPDNCLVSGGRAYFDDDGEDFIEFGDWKVSDWPSNFLEKYKEATLDAINNDIPHGCCGGCL